METPLVPEVLLQHGQFVRALARGLLRDAHAAEDLAQETWTRALERPPAAERGLRPWLAAVTRNLAANLGRGQGRRAERERVAARAEALPSAHEELEHAELVRVVAEEVVALDEPYRETIVARYYRGVDAQTFAARSGMSASTVRNREHRALEMLRERLDRRFHGERAAWAAALARIAGPTEGEVAGSPSSRWPLALATAVPIAVLAVAGAAMWMRTRSTPEVSLASAPAAIASIGDPVRPAEHEQPLAAPVSPSLEQRNAVASEPANRASATNASLAEVRGHFVFPGGAPAAGTSVYLSGMEANDALVLQYGLPENWVDPKCETDADGRFSLRFDPPPAYQFSLDAAVPGHAGASWRWGTIQPGRTIDLGEVELPVGGTIEGRIVDAQGNALVGEKWIVYARTKDLGEGEGRDDSQVMARVDRATASFRLEDVWPTRIVLSAHSEMTNEIQGPTVVVQSGETLSADIVYSGPSTAKRITVSTSCMPFHTQSSVEQGHVRLIGPGGEVITSPERKAFDHSFDHTFDDLAPGAYAIEIDDPRFLPWSRAGVMPGESVRASLVGTSALRLSVLDSAEQPVELYSVRVTLRSSSWTPNEFEVHDGKSALAGGLVSGMVPGDWTVEVRTEDGSTGRSDVDALTSGETRDVRLELASSFSVAGRVAHPDGEGAQNADVQLLSPAEQDDSNDSQILGPGCSSSNGKICRRQLGGAYTDSSGAFHMDVTSRGPFLLRACSDGSQTFSQVFTLDAARDDFEFVLPRSGAVRGRIHSPADASLDGLSLWIAPASLWDADGKLRMGSVDGIRTGQSLDQCRTSLAADGSFLLEHLPPGPSRALLVITEAVANAYTACPAGVYGTVVLGNLEVPSGETLDQDFTASELPGWIEFDLLVNGQPAPNAWVSLLGPLPISRGEVTDERGHFGPKRLVTGTWSVSAGDRSAGWDGLVPGTILLHSGEHVSTVLDVPVIGGTVTCVDAEGGLLAGEPLTLVHFDENHPGQIRAFSRNQTRRTDETGRLELFLVPGEYGLVHGDYKFGHWEDLTAPHVLLTWTTSGPLVERVQL